MSQFLAYFNLYLVTGAACFVAGVVFSQKVKDWVAGIPGDLRKGLKTIETAVIAKAKSAQAAAIAEVYSPPTPVPAPTPVPPPTA